MPICTFPLKSTQLLCKVEASRDVCPPVSNIIFKIFKAPTPAADRGRFLNFLNPKERSAPKWLCFFKLRALGFVFPNSPQMGSFFQARPKWVCFFIEPDPATNGFEA